LGVFSAIVSWVLILKLTKSNYFVILLDITNKVSF
jgi:hypothetical protein